MALQSTESSFRPWDDGTSSGNKSALSPEKAEPVEEFAIDFAVLTRLSWVRLSSL